MEPMQWLTLIVFGLTILAVITNVIDSTLAALLGVALMCWLGIMTEKDAFNYVDWNVMAILVGIWIIAGYFGKTGVPSWLSIQALKALRRAAGPAGHHPDVPRGLYFDVCRQRRHHPDDGAGGAAADAGAQAALGAGHFDDRFRREFHGHRADHRRPAAADAAQRRWRRIFRLHLAVSAGHRRFRS